MHLEGALLQFVLSRKAFVVPIPQLDFLVALATSRTDVSCLHQAQQCSRNSRGTKDDVLNIYGSNAHTC